MSEPEDDEDVEPTASEAVEAVEPAPTEDQAAESVADSTERDRRALEIWQRIADAVDRTED